MNNLSTFILNWNDAHSYEWRFSNVQASHFDRAAYAVGAVTVGPTVTILLLYGINKYSNSISNFIGILLLIFMILSHFFGVWRQFHGDVRDRVNAGWESAGCAVIGIGLLLFLLWKPGSPFEASFKEG